MVSSAAQRLRPRWLASTAPQECSARVRAPPLQP